MKNLKEMAEEMMIKATCMEQLAEFLEEQKTPAHEVLSLFFDEYKEALEFQGCADNLDPYELTLRAAIVGIFRASDLEDNKHNLDRARWLAALLQFALVRIYENPPDAPADIEVLASVLDRVYPGRCVGEKYTVDRSKTPLQIMREIVAQHPLAPEAENIQNLRQAIDAAEPAGETKGNCLRAFEKVMNIIDPRDAGQLAAVLETFIEDNDPGNLSFAEIALPVLTESLAGQDGRGPVPSAKELGRAMEWFIQAARVKHGPERDRDTDYEFVTGLLGALKDRGDFSCKAAVLRSLGVANPTIHLGSGVKLEPMYETFRCLEFRAHKLDPAHHYQEDELLHMDGEGDEVVSAEAIRIGEGATVAVQLLDEATAADALRILRKVIGAIEKNGLRRGVWTDYTEHSGVRVIDAHIAALRGRETAEVGA